MERIAVIMSVYNGRRYLAEQIDSVLGQTYKNIDIFIHDDGSQDGSVEIINEYANKYENVHYIKDATGQGYPKCFIYLLEKVSGYDFYAFCDQDDVWKKDKIENGIVCLNKSDQAFPLLYYTAVDYCDERLNYIRGSRFAKGKTVIEQMSLQMMMFGGEAMGMTFVFNDVARVALLKANTNEESYKDWFLKVYCAACGKVYYNPISSAFYRRHEAAVTNGSNPSGRLKRYWRQFREVFFSENGFNEQKRIFNYLLHNEKSKIDHDDIKLLELFSMPNTMGKRIKKFWWQRRYRSRILDEIGYRFAFLLGRI